MSIPTITTNELFRLQDQEPTTLIVDVRTPAEFRTVHARGVVNAPLNDLDPAAIVNAHKVDPGTTIYMICKMGGRSHKACEKFVASGYSNVANVVGGTDQWILEGHPVVDGEKKVISLDRQVRIMAGSLVFIGSALGYFIHSAWIGLPALIGAGFLFSGLTDTCGMGSILAKMPWNSPRDSANQSPPTQNPSRTEPVAKPESGG
ncbi:MAG: rhodanese-like domain-containing protein [Planctomycetota bacterium]